MFRTRTLPAAAAALLLAFACAGEAAAHAKVVASSPAANATVAAPSQIVLKFSEKLEPKFSTFELVAPGGTKIPVKTLVSEDRTTLLGAPARLLTPGAYSVDWRIVSSDGHRMQGSLIFTVR